MSSASPSGKHNRLRCEHGRWELQVCLGKKLPSELTLPSTAIELYMPWGEQSAWTTLQ